MTHGSQFPRETDRQAAVGRERHELRRPHSSCPACPRGAPTAHPQDETAACVPWSIPAAVLGTLGTRSALPRRDVVTMQGLSGRGTVSRGALMRTHPEQALLAPRAPPEGSTGDGHPEPPCIRRGARGSETPGPAEEEAEPSLPGTDGADGTMGRRDPEQAGGHTEGSRAQLRNRNRPRLRTAAGHSFPGHGEPATACSAAARRP